MSIRTCFVAAGLAALATAGWSDASQALSMKECSTKYRAARSAGTLGGMTWNEFRKAQCEGSGAAATKQAPAAAQNNPNTYTGIFGGGTAPAYKYSFGGGAVFPRGISPKYAGMPVAKARMHTCLDQYRVNKTNGGNGQLKWIQKGGGYYSQCNRQLKGMQ
jgi:hypothetical protein